MMFILKDESKGTYFPACIVSAGNRVCNLAGSRRRCGVSHMCKGIRCRNRAFISWLCSKKYFAAAFKGSILDEMKPNK